MKLYGRNLSKQEFLRYAGGVSQVGGIESGELSEGTSRGVRTVTVKTAGGLEYVIVPDCGMNIASCSYKGVPICWRSGTGSTNSGLYDPQLSGWLRSFNGGLLVTCGLSQIGAACVDEGWPTVCTAESPNTPAKSTLFWASGSAIATAWCFEVRCARAWLWDSASCCAAT